MSQFDQVSSREENKLPEDMKEREMLLRYCLEMLRKEGLNNLQTDIHPAYHGKEEGLKQVEAVASSKRLDRTIYWLHLLKQAAAKPGVDPELKKIYETHKPEPAYDPYAGMTRGRQGL